MIARRHAIAVTIIAFWLVMVGSLYWRVSMQPTNELPQRLRLGPSETWMTIYLPGDEPAGYLHVQETPERRDDRPGVRIQARVTANLVLLGRLTPIFATGQAWRSVAGDFTSFDFRLRSGDHQMRIDGIVDGGSLRGQFHTAGEAIPINMPVGNDFGLLPALDMPDIEVGQHYTVQGFDPLTMTRGTTHLECLREELFAYDGQTTMAKVVRVRASSMESVAWVGPGGQVLRLETPLGFVLQRTTAEAALAKAKESPQGDMLAIAAIQPTGREPFAGASRMRVRLTGIRDDEQPAPDDTQQRLDDGSYVITAPKNVAEDRGEPSAAYLESTTFVQSDHPRIRSMAESIAADASTRWERAQAIHRWVYESIAKEATFSVPSALEVLETRRGDCNEHTVLYAALARAVDVPTRIAVGVVWSEEYAGFYYHAWPEVFVDDRWVWIDPTLGQSVADAAHIKLLTGEIQQWAELVPYLSRLKIEVIEVE